MSRELDALQESFRVLIVGTCNTIGCKECPYKWEGGCSSDEIQNRIYDLENADLLEKG